MECRVKYQFPEQFSVGRDGLTHNMLEMIHCHWRRQEICKVRCRGVPTVDMKNLCYHLEVSIISMLLHINVHCTRSHVLIYPPGIWICILWYKAKDFRESLFLKFVFFYCTTKCGIQYAKVPSFRKENISKSEMMFFFISVLNCMITQMTLDYKMF